MARRFDRTKWAALGVAILLPTAIYFFFKVRYGHPEVDYPEKLYPLGTTDTFYREADVVVDSVYHTIPPFTLTSTLRDTFTRHYLADRITIIGLFRSDDPTVAPAITENLGRVQENFIRDDNMQIVRVGVGPADSIEALRRYAADAGAVPGKWFFLTGAREEILTLGEGLRINVAVDSTGHMTYSDRLVLVDDELNIRGYYDATDSLVLNEMMQDMVLVNKK